MRIKFVLFAFLILCIEELFAQSDNGWMFLSPFPFGNDLLDVKFENENTGYILSNGMIFRTSNFGNNWTILNRFNDYPDTLLQTFDKTNNVIYIAGDKGKMIKSTNGGDSFFNIYTGVSSNIIDVCFINENTGFFGAVQYFKRTTNGGLNWINILPSFTATITEIKFADEMTGYAVANGGRVYKTINGGINWSEQNIGANINLNSLSILSTQLVYVCGENGFISRTINGGQNWSQQVSGTSENLLNIVFYNENIGYVTSNIEDWNLLSSKVRKTINGGMIWSNSFEIQNSTIKKSISVNENRLMFVGSNGYISHSLIKELISQISIYKLKNSIKGINFVNENTGLIINDTGQCLTTSNGGVDWENIGTRAPNNVYIHKSYILNQNTGFVIGYIPNDDFFLDVFRTTNSGINWTEISKDTSDFLNITFLNDQNFLMSSGDGLLKSTDGGSNWFNINPNAPFATETNFINENIGYAVEINGRTLQKTTNGGINWDTIYFNRSSQNPIDNLSFISEGKGYFSKSGYSGFSYFYNIFRTTNDGQTWDSLKITNIYKYISDIKFISENVGFIIADKIYKTTNFGLNFLPVNYSANSDLHELYFLNSNTGFAFSIYKGINHKSLMKTTNGGTIFVNTETQTINNFYLSQNYPNPFNPTTTIRFNLSKPQFVTLKVYDIMGREVQTLVNDIKQSGEHRVEFNGGLLSSGVYFYKLTSGEFVDVKKMILLK